MRRGPGRSALTYSVSDLGEEVRLFLGEAFVDVWVAGEVQRLRPSRSGHLYLELVEKGVGDTVLARFDAVIWRSSWHRIQWVLERAGLTLGDGLEIRCRGRIDFYPPGGRLQLVVDSVDPTFSVGLLARRRREVLEALGRLGLLERNRSLPWPALPLEVGLVTSKGSAAYHDVLSGLAESGYPFRIRLVDVAVQGASAEGEIARAVERLGRAGVDCLLLVRGGGARGDLAVFDALAVAEAVATCPVPVVTGLGHEIDRAIADEVAAAAVKTPTKAAELLVERVGRAEVGLEEMARGLAAAAQRRLGAGAGRLDRSRSRLLVAGRRLELSRRRIDAFGTRLAALVTHRLRGAGRAQAVLVQRLAAAGGRLLTRRRTAPTQLAERLDAAVERRLRREAERLDGRARLVAQLSPRRVLERGFSITRGPDGRVVRRPADAPPGSTVETELAEGRLRSIVEAP